MHALPEKLASLRREVEDSVRRQFLEQQARSEKQIQEASARAEEAAVRRATALFDPKFEALAGKSTDEPLVPLSAQLEEITASCRRQVGTVRQEVSTLKDNTNKRFIDIRAEMVPVAATARKSSDSVRDIEAAQKEIRELLTSTRKDLASSSDGLRERLEEEVQRAQSIEASIRRSVHDVVNNITAAQRKLADHADQMAAHAAQEAEQQAVRIEARLWKRLETHAQEIALQASASKAAEAAEQVERQLDEHRASVEEHTARLEAKLEDECHAVCAGMTAAAEVAAGRAAAEHAERHSAEAARAHEQAKRELEGRWLDALGEARGKSLEGALDWHAALGAQGDNMKAAIRRAEEYADEVAKAAEQRAAEETERRLAEALAKLRQEMDAERGELQRKEETAREDLRERLQNCLRDCQQHCDTAAQRHEATAQALAARLLVAPAHALAARATSADSADSELQLADRPPRRLGDSATIEAEGIRKELHRFQEGTGREVSLLRSEIADRLTRQEACESAVASATVTSEALGRIAALEAALTRQRERIDSAVRDLGARCDAFRVDLFDARAKTQQELHILGTELSRQQAAGASLVQGVCRALQVIGLLREIPELDQQQPPDGDLAASVRRPCGGMELRHLLEWEARGQSLAVRVSQQWHSLVAEPWPSTLVEWLQTKADQRDLLSVRTTLRLWSPMPSGPTGPALALAGAAQPLPLAASRDRAEAALGALQSKTGLHPQPPCTPRGPLAPLSPWRKGGEAPKAV